jgi:uncharacterized protein (TIGR03083 family)
VPDPVRHDYLAALSSDTRRIVDALGRDRDGAIPWCGTWTVKDCAQHVGGAHRVIAKVVKGRPDADFSVAAEIAFPDVDDPGLGDWLTTGSAALVDVLSGVGPDQPCWSWAEDRTVGFWMRRMAHETLVHRWDVERGAGVEVIPTDPALAADGVDEYLDVFVARTRQRNAAPGAGESVQVISTDTGDEWVIVFSAEGQRELRRDRSPADAVFRGTAEALLLHLCGRLDSDAAGVEILGDRILANRWRELVPAI